MKFIISALILFVVIDKFSEAIPTTYEENTFTEIRHCKNHHECPSGSCCVLTQTRFAHPYCEERPKSGHVCRPKPMKETDRVLDYMNGGKIFLQEAYMNICPCARGLVCDVTQHVCREPKDYYTEDIEQ